MAVLQNTEQQQQLQSAVANTAMARTREQSYLVPTLATAWHALTSARRRQPPLQGRSVAKRKCWYSKSRILSLILHGQINQSMNEIDRSH